MSQHKDFIGLVMPFDLTNIVRVEARLPVHQSYQPASMRNKRLVTLSFPAEGIDAMRRLRCFIQFFLFSSSSHVR